MFKLNEKYEIKRSILEFETTRYSPTQISTINFAKSQIDEIIPGEDRFISLLNSYRDLNFNVLHAASFDRYVDNKDIRIVNLGPIVYLAFLG